MVNDRQMSLGSNEQALCQELFNSAGKEGEVSPFVQMPLSMPFKGCHFP